MRALWHVIVGRRCGARAASGDGVAADRTGSNGIPSPLSVVCGVWGSYASPVASSDARREFWAPDASDGGVFDGSDRGESAEVHEIFATLYQTAVSVGSVGALEQAVSAALATPVAEAQPYVQRQPVRNADETSWREKGKRRWLWISVTPLVTIFRLLRTRGAVGAKELLGEVVWGIIGTDHYAGYHWIDPRQRQLCWAHLKREFVAWSERTGETARMGLALLAVEKQLFVLWYRCGMHVGRGRLSSGDAAADGARPCAPPGRRGRGRRENARHVSESA